MAEQSKQELLDALPRISRHYGVDPEFVIAGGGNTSVKMDKRLFVKGSGHALATITPDGFVEMDRPALEALLGIRIWAPIAWCARSASSRAVMAARIAPEKGQRPSVEVVLHHLMPRRFVVHTHATLVNMFTCAEAGKRLIDELCGDQIIWIADVDPGHVLAQTLRDALKDYQPQDRPRLPARGHHAEPRAGRRGDRR
jgi:rhamnose utilization protein RhaD (predicted bifunctional aldolase and dehydrogenase)